jgi:hypothetical protein
MNKKAGFGIMIGIILAVVVFLIFLSSFGKISLIINSGTEDVVCTWSAAANSLKIKQTEDIIDLKCPVKNLLIRYVDNELSFYKKGNEISIAIPERYIHQVEEWNEGAYNFTKNEDVQRYKFNTFIARELINCKNKLGGGNLDLFSSNFFTSNSICAICSRIVMDETELENFKNDINEGDNNYVIDGNFFMKNPYSFENLVTTKSLWEELKFPTSSDMFSSYKFDLNKNILIYYLVYKDAAGIGGIIPFFGLSKKDEALKHSLLVSDPQNLAKYCTIVGN